MSDTIRLNRYVAMSGVASRRKAEDIIRAGRIAVNGDIVTDPARGIHQRTDTVTLDGRPLAAAHRTRYLVLNKPVGIIVSVGDTHGRRTVLDLIDGETRGLFPVGRLDLYTSGVLIITDDGDLAHRLMHPSYGVEKVYHAQVNGVVGEDVVKRFRDGIVLEDGQTAPAKLTVLSHTNALSMVEVVIHQGKKRQVRRMLDVTGHPVRKLERVSFGGITADGLKRGKYRQLTPEEVASLKKQVGLE